MSDIKFFQGAAQNGGSNEIPSRFKPYYQDLTERYPVIETGGKRGVDKLKKTLAVEGKTDPKACLDLAKMQYLGIGEEERGEAGALVYLKNALDIIKENPKDHEDTLVDLVDFVVDAIKGVSENPGEKFGDYYQQVQSALFTIFEEIENVCSQVGVEVPEIFSEAEVYDSADIGPHEDDPLVIF